MLRRSLLVLLLTLPLVGVTAPAAESPVSGAGAGGPTTVILVRHAEKLADSGDPDLSKSGHSRARELNRVLADVPLEALYATQYLRTRRTLEPIASARGLEVTVDRVDGGDLPGYSRRFAANLLERHAGETVLVAGHSNTVPTLIEALGVSPAPTIGEMDYDDLFVVSRSPGGKARILHLHYGAGSATP